MDAWIQDELSGCELGVERVNQRLAHVVKDLSPRIGKVRASEVARKCTSRNTPDAGRTNSARRPLLTIRKAVYS